MRAIHLFAAAVITAVLAASAFSQEAALFDELDVLYPDTDVSSGTEHLVTDTPRGVICGVHLLATGLRPGAKVRLGVSCETGDAADAALFRMIPVPVEQNTGVSTRTETWDGKENPHVIREAPFHVFEAFEPVESFTTIAGNDGVCAMRVEKAIAYGAAPCGREYIISIIAGGRRINLRWEVVIHGATVPRTGAQSPGYTNWFSPALIAERHSLRLWSEPFWKMLALYADLMARGRQNTFWIRWTDFMSLDKMGKLIVNQQRLNRYVRTFLDRGFKRIEGGHLARRHNDDWSRPRLDLILTRTDSTSEKGRAELDELISAIEAAVNDAGIPGRAEYLQHISDEPTNTNAKTYAALVEQVRSRMPGVEIFDATMSQELVDSVDHWCPKVQEYQKNREFFEARKKAGDEVWVYTCLSPGGPWLNRLLDQERLRPLFLGWSLVKYDLAGFLHWGLNHYRKGMDPFLKSVVPHGNGPPNFLPAGDTHVVFPGKLGPLSGQRFEAHRIGFEDAELLLMLKKRDPVAADKIIGSMFRAYDDYEKKVAAYRTARKKLITVCASTSDRVLVVVDDSVYPEIGTALDNYFNSVKSVLPQVEFQVLIDGFYEMKPSEIRASLKKEYELSSGTMVGAIMVGPIPHALRGDPETILITSPLYYEEYDAEWIDENNDGVFDKIITDRINNETEIWTAWWVPPSNDRAEQAKMLKVFLDKLVRYYQGEIMGRDGVVFIAGNGNSVEITESWTVLLDEALATAGQKVARVYSLDGQMKEAVLPDPGPEFISYDLLDLLTGHCWQHLHTLTHGSPAGFYWHNGEEAIAVTTENIDFSGFNGTGPVIFTTSGCSNGVFRGRLKGEPLYSRSIANRMLFSPNTATIAFFGSASPQSASVFAGFHTELVESLAANGSSYIGEGCRNFRNADYSWGLKHFIFRGVDGKVLSGDPFAKYR